MRFSLNGLTLLKQLEEFRPSVYTDGKGRSIGYGHQLLPNETFSKITEMEGEKLLKKDVLTREAYVNNLKLNLNQNQFDALVIRAYNGYFGTQFLLQLKKYDFNMLFPVWRKYNHVNGIENANLSARIEKEIALFQTPVSDLKTYLPIFLLAGLVIFH